MGHDKVDSMSWVVEHYFKGPEDYKPLMFLARDERYISAYDGYHRLREQMEGEAFLKDGGARHASARHHDHLHGPRDI